MNPCAAALATILLTALATAQQPPKSDSQPPTIPEKKESITVTADVKDASILFPDPAQRVFVRQEILDANPGRPGAPISIPGLPIETASGGIKAPQYFNWGLLQESVSKEYARDLDSGLPTPEAPRLIVDILGTVNRLPLGLQARAEFEEVGAKPLGYSFRAVPVREFRGALVRVISSQTYRCGHQFFDCEWLHRTNNRTSRGWG